MARVLVVDDNEDILHLIQTMLQTNGYDVRLAKSGREALDSVEGELPQLILLDVMMPGMSGIQVLEELRAASRSARVPVILLTAKTQDEDVITGYQSGADYYITKPFTAKQLLYGIRLMLGHEAAS